MKELRKRRLKESIEKRNGECNDDKGKDNSQYLRQRYSRESRVRQWYVMEEIGKASKNNGHGEAYKLMGKQPLAEVF